MAVNDGPWNYPYPFRADNVVCPCNTAWGSVPAPPRCYIHNPLDVGVGSGVVGVTTTWPAAKTVEQAPFTSGYAQLVTPRPPDYVPEPLTTPLERIEHELRLLRLAVERMTPPAPVTWTLPQISEALQAADYDGKNIYTDPSALADFSGLGGGVWRME